MNRCFKFCTLTAEQVYTQGIKGLWIILISAIVSGQVVLTEYAYHIRLIIEDLSFVPGFASLLTLTEFGPMLSCLLLVAFSGASIAAETSMLKLTEQWDALKLEQVSVAYFFIWPRVLGCMVVSLCLTLISTGGQLLTSLISSPFLLHLSWWQYSNKMFSLLDIQDLAQSLFKAAMFGVSFPAIAIYLGLKSKNTAASIGTKCTQAVVYGTLAIIMEDFLISFLFALG